MEIDIQSIMEKAVRAFQPDNAAGIDAKIQFHLIGHSEEDWVATIHDKNLSVEPGITAEPDLMFSAESKDVLDIYSGKLDPMKAFIQGKVQFKGDMRLAMRLVGVFGKSI